MTSWDSRRGLQADQVRHRSRMALRHDRSYLNDGCNDRSISPVVTDDGPANAPNYSTGTSPLLRKRRRQDGHKGFAQIVEPKKRLRSTWKDDCFWIHATTGRCEAGARVCRCCPPAPGAYDRTRVVLGAMGRHRVTTLEALLGGDTMA